LRWHRPIERKRVVAFVIVVVIEALIMLALVRLAVSPTTSRKLQNDLVAFSLSTPKAETEKAKRSSTPTPRKTVEKAAAKKQQSKLPVQPIPTPNMVPMSHDDFAASDIGKLPKSSGGAGSKSAAGPGSGPGGQTLYPADWYREPSRYVLAESLPNGAPNGAWATIACRTIEHYHVENCVGIGESHVGLAQALRRAAWQFLVLPPRVNGRPQIGAWVRIRFDFTQNANE
jgi:hypothetical protein